MSRRGRILAAIGALAAASVLTALAVATDGREESSALATRWISLRPAPLARTEVAAARIGDAIYVVGGFVPAGPVTTSAVERYDIAANRWTRVRSMPLALNHPAATAHGGALYVVGGYTGSAGLSGETNAFLRYDPSANRWTRMPPMPTARAALAVGVLGDRLYAAGGARAGGRPLTTLEVFDFRTRRWAAGPAMAVAREHVAGATTGGSFYVLGGRRHGLNNLRTTERYVPALRRWQRLPDMRTARSGIAAATIGARVLVFGGEEPGRTVASVELYDPRLRRWLPRPPMSHPAPRPGRRRPGRPRLRDRGRRRARFLLLAGDRGSGRPLRPPARRYCCGRGLRTSSTFCAGPSVKVNTNRLRPVIRFTTPASGDFSTELTVGGGPGSVAASGRFSAGSSCLRWNSKALRGSSPGAGGRNTTTLSMPFR